MGNNSIVRKHIIFYGYVQGVGFRYRARHAADLYGCTGWVRNECADTGPVCSDPRIAGTKGGNRRKRSESSDAGYHLVYTRRMREAETYLGFSTG